MKHSSNTKRRDAMQMGRWVKPILGRPAAILLLPSFANAEGRTYFMNGMAPAGSIRAANADWSNIL